MVFNVCVWVTEMDYARKTDRATGQPVKETGCASETVRAMRQFMPVGNTIIFQTNIDRVCKSQRYSFMIRNIIPNLYITKLRGRGGFGTLDPLSINFTQFIIIALFYFSNLQKSIIQSLFPN